MTDEQIEMISILGMMRSDMRMYANQRAGYIPQMEAELAKSKQALEEGLASIEKTERAIEAIASGDSSPRDVWDSIRETVTPNGLVLELCERFGWTPPPPRPENAGPDGRPLQ